MVRPVTIALLLALLPVFSPLAVAWAVQDDAIRPLRGPLPPSGLPPFTATVIILLCLGSLLWYRRRKAVRAPVVSEPTDAPVSPGDQLALLLEEVGRQHRQPAEIIERLLPILRSLLAGKSGTSADHYTSQELLVRLHCSCDTEALLRTAELLRLCDSVWFGGVVPTFEQAEWALQGTLLLFENHNESISYNTGKKALYFPPPLQGEGWGGDGVDCCIPAHKQDLNHPHPHPNLPPGGEGTKDFGGLS